MDTFHYFNFNTRGDAMRMLLAKANVEYKDTRYGFDVWPEIKPTFPNQQIPCLELADGTKIGQSVTILRYFGKVNGFYPEDPLQASHVDFLLETYQDVLGKFYGPFFAAEDKKEAMITEIFEKTLPAFLENISKYIKADGFLVGDKLTIADFWVGGLYTNFMNHAAIGFAADKWAACKEKYPLFAAYGERFALENEAYLSSRPVVPI